MPQTSPSLSRIFQDAHTKSSWRWIIPVCMILLALFILTWLPLYSQKQEAEERQAQLIADALWVEQTIQFQLNRDAESMRVIADQISQGHLKKEQFRDYFDTLFRSNREFFRISWINPAQQLIASTEPENEHATFMPLSTDARNTLHRSRANHTAIYGAPSALDDQDKRIALNLYVPIFREGRYAGHLIVTYLMQEILNEMVPWWFARDHEISLTDSQNEIYAHRLSGGYGQNIYTYQRSIELPGLTLMLYANSTKSEPRIFSNVLVAAITVLALGLVGSLWALWNDIRRRMSTEQALKREISFRKAMEDSLITGMRARDLQGRITYVNQAFCNMVGFPASDILGHTPPMPYWDPEAMDEYSERFSNMLEGRFLPQYETIFQRSDGERITVLVFESPLINHKGQHTGWMGSILDITAQKKAQEINRLQEEKLQSSARLAYMGEITSTLAHELNQPLAAIASYATGATNLIHKGKTDITTLLPALDNIHAQAQRAGNVIRSIHQFVKKHEPTRQPLATAQLLDNIMPLIELQARSAMATVQLHIADHLPLVLGDQALLEQVILNLVRNGIHALAHIPVADRILRIAAECTEDDVLGPTVTVSITDHGTGIAEEVVPHLFSPFFSTKPDGMGMGLNICRTLIEFHGGILRHRHHDPVGTVFSFSLPVHDTDQTQQQRQNNDMHHA